MLYMRHHFSIVALVILLATVGAGTPVRAVACDVCAIYIATENHPARSGLRLGVAEQFSHFSRLKDDGKTIDNPGERLNSSITQLVAGYDFSSNVGVQMTIPLVDRHYRRREEGLIRSGRESGIGDVSVLAVVRPFHHVTDDAVVRVSLLGGLELPTGDTDRLREELDEGDAGATALTARGRAPSEEPRRSARHAGPHGNEHVDDGLSPLGVHGHDLALGSGSLDAVVGATVFASWKRWFWTTAAQYAIRSEGDFDYRYANEVTWSGGPGWFALLAHGYTFALQALLTGEHKGLDELAGREADDTGITALYLGPAVSFTHGASLVADLALDVPVRQNNTSVQLVPDFRVRGGVSWRF